MDADEQQELSRTDTVHPVKEQATVHPSKDQEDTSTASVLEVRDASSEVREVSSSIKKEASSSIKETSKATKSDDAAVAVEEWVLRLVAGLGLEANEDTAKAARVLRKWRLIRWKRGSTQGFSRGCTSNQITRELGLTPRATW
jgi:hypothetical protein